MQRLTDLDETTDVPEDEPEAGPSERVYLCDRCGFQMVETNCKVVCPNCGSRWDCSDLSIYMD